MSVLSLPLLMAASSTPIEQTWHPRSLLPYDALPHCQDFDSIKSDAKSTVESRTDVYDRSLASRRYALVGVACSSIISCSCIIAGIVTLARQGVSGVMVTNIVSVEPMSAMIQITQLDLQRELLALILNLIITLCTEPIGFVHGISLRSALASESRLHFNTNLRLLTAARGWHNPNGALLNGIMAILLIVSYTSSSVVLSYNFSLASNGSDIAVSIAIAGLPLLSLGVALLLQVMIALSGMRAVKILTWSSSPFDLTAALVHHAQLAPVTFRCMRCVSDRDVDGGPAKPSETQPSAWQAHPSIQRVVISLWELVAACAGWAALIMYIWDKHASARMTTNPALPTWSFFPNGNPSAIAYTIPGLNIQGWILIFVNLAVVQAPLTLGLHYSELIANVVRDERQWRCATRRKGLRVATNPLKSIFAHPTCLVLFLAKPFLHWMFGLSFFVYDLAGDETVEKFAVGIYTAQIWNLCIALAIFACFFTLVALRRPRGPQPATYGHIQTLANLVDEWSPVMWWGHKQDQIPYCHAGTSDHPLPDVKMDCVYAGFGVESPAFENTFLD